MKPKKSMQRSFHDTDFICEQLILQDSFYRKFREKVVPLIDDEMFSSMYCSDNGRPPISPALLAMATILQFHKNLSDREMERACMFDIEIKYALGLKLNERPFDHSSLGDFRNRLLEHGKEKEIFDHILQELVNQGVVGKDEVQRIDATHILADIAIPNMVVMVKKGVRGILNPLSKRHKSVHKIISELIDLSDYTRIAVNHDVDGRHDMDKKNEKLVQIVEDARAVLRHAEKITNDPIVSKRVAVLKRILRERITEDENGKTKEIPKQERKPDLIVSPVDPDARHGAKTRTHKFHGYKANLTETVNSRFITNIKVTQGNKPDGLTTVENVTEQRDKGLVPVKLIGDTAYSDGIFRKELNDNGTTLVAPLRMMNERTKSIFTKNMFKYDEEKNMIICPRGVKAKQTFKDHKRNRRVFHFPMSRCNRCDVQQKCTNAKEGRRTMSISSYHKELMEAEKYNRTEQFKEDIKLRQPIEGKISELKRYHGLTRTRYRGLNKVGLQCYFSAVAVNIKRWIKLEAERFKVKQSRLVVA